MDGIRRSIVQDAQPLAKMAVKSVVRPRKHPLIAWPWITKGGEIWLCRLELPVQFDIRLRSFGKGAFKLHIFYFPLSFLSAPNNYLHLRPGRAVSSCNPALPSSLSPPPPLLLRPPTPPPSCTLPSSARASGPISLTLFPRLSPASMSAHRQSACLRAPPPLS